MNKNNIIYKNIRKKISESSRQYTNDSDYVDQVTDYVIKISGIENFLDALARIDLSRMEVEEYLKEKDSDYWYKKVKRLQDIAKDALMKGYRGE